MDNLIRVYDNVLSPEKCKYFIDKFESNSQMHSVQDNTAKSNRDLATLTKIDMASRPDSPFLEDIDFLIKTILDCASLYKKDVLTAENQQWPKNYGVESPKIKRYLPNSSDEFPDHVDVANVETSMRFLVMFIYLDDNEKGETALTLKDDVFISSCKKGSCLVFPPYWPWLHCGRKVIDKPKYIIGSYLHHVSKKLRE